MRLGIQEERSTKEMSTVKKTSPVRSTRSAVTTVAAGFRDRLPGDASYWQAVSSKIQLLVEDYGFQNIDTPLVEDAKLYSVLKGTDFVVDQLIAIQDPQERSLVLRPESLLAMARAYREHSFGNLPQPLKLSFLSPQFRAEPKVGSGSLWQFTQFGCVVFGDPHPIVDAQLIAAYYFLFRELHLDIRLHVNSLGHDVCRDTYQALLLDYFRAQRNALCDQCKEKLSAKQPLLLFSCQQAGCQDIIQSAPQIVDHLCDTDREHFVKALEHLDEVDVEYMLDPRLIANTALYNRTVVKFIITPSDREPYSLAVGGHVDQLHNLVGGTVTPGFSMIAGLERIVLAMKENNVQLPPPPAPDVFIAQLGDAARRKSFQLFLKLRSEGIRASESLSKAGIKEQLENATRLKAKFALILGQEEIIDGTILIRDMENGIQEVNSFDKVIPEVKRRLAKIAPSTFVTTIPPATDVSAEATQHQTPNS